MDKDNKKKYPGEYHTFEDLKGKTVREIIVAGQIRKKREAKEKAAAEGKTKLTTDDKRL